ncbi:DUF1302 family protein [Stigmatella aurantiaca]|uniref:Uncharacterized protein n=1 Tax=Stigmatella aurantiaca (strain DW4/3-1) TaxID=378806 RepID=Q08Y86_STIAD|nr:DUF1302 family protein [Stigmatella aurantiaca]ADO67958.1 uncharacterized protein STAUR_0149 [Stigmatella aurantiaca DW4/3-1]EAU65420.1 hypothetical protein STIAU_2853 [Stigmatella aurantiaca DW4/3-1]
MLKTILRFLPLAVCCGLVAPSGAQASQEEPAPEQVPSSAPDPDLEGMPGLSEDPDLMGMPGPGEDAPGAVSGVSPGATAGSSFSFRGRFRSQINMDLAADRAGEDLVELQNSFDLEADLRLTSAFSARLSGRLFHDLRSPERDFGGAARAFYDGELRDAVVFVNWGRISLEVGQQTVRWGSTELNSPNDIINPTDFRRGPGVDFEVPVLPVPLVRAAYTGDQAGGELVYVPFFFPNRGYAFGSDWTVLLVQPPLLAALQQSVTLPARTGVAEEALFAANAPSFMPRNGSLGGRAFLRGSGWDARLNVFYGWDRIPELVFSPPGSSSAPFRSTFYRELSVGVDGSAVMDDFIFRADLRFSTRRTFYTQALVPFRDRALSWAGGVEFRERFLLELSGIWLPGRTAEDEPLFLIDRHMASAALVYRDTFLRERLKVNVGVQYGLVKRDWVVSGVLAFDVQPGHELAGGVLWLEGKPFSLGGLFDANDYAFARYTYAF